MSRQQIAAGELRIASLLGFSHKHAGSKKYFFADAHITPMGPVSSVYMVRALSFGVYTPELEKSRLTGTQVAIEMGGAGELRGTVWAELRLGKDGYIAFVRAHPGYRTVLSVLDDSPHLRYRKRGSDGICAMTGGGRATGHVRREGRVKPQRLSTRKSIGGHIQVGNALYMGLTTSLNPATPIVNSISNDRGNTNLNLISTQFT